MQRLYSPRGRSERIIAAGRVVLAGSSLLAVWLDPSEPTKYAPIAYSLLVAYLAVSAIVALLVWRPRARPIGQPLLSQIADLAFFSLFIYFSAGPSSAFFVFSLVCGTLRWGWRGTLWTAVAALSAFLTLGAYFSLVLDDPDFQLDQLIIRGVYLGVVAVLLGYLGAHEEQTQRVLGMLAAAPQGPLPRDMQALLEEVLSHAAAVLAVPRAVLAWSEEEEPWLRLALWRHGNLEIRRETPDRYQPLVAAEVADGSWWWGAATGGDTVRLRAGTLDVWNGRPLAPELGEVVSATSAIGARVRGESIDGHLVFLDPASQTVDDLLLAEVVAGLVSARLDHFYLLQRLQETAAVEERIRLARDLHDGVLQSLTGVALRLAAVRARIEEDPAAARQGLEEMQRLISLEQRELRFFIHELTPLYQRGGEAPGELAQRLESLVDRVEREWGVKVDCRLEGLVDGSVEPRTRDVYLLVREAVVNAARHGQASRVEVRVERRLPGGIAIAVSDDGRGFPFSGRFSGEELARQGVGPRTLRERVAALDGAFELSSTRAGARVEIALPPVEP